MNEIEKQWQQFFSLITTPFPSEQKEELWQKAVTHLRENNYSEYALIEHLLTFDKKNQVLLLVDWKASEEVEWQAQALAATWNLSPDFHWDWQQVSEEEPAVYLGLVEFDHWLQNHGMRFFTWDTESDEYCGFILPEQQMREIFKLSRPLKLKIKLGPKE